MSDQTLKYMLFTCKERRFAVDITAVDEISELVPKYQLPDSPRFLRGVVAIHGKFAAVLDLSMYLGFGPVRDGQNLLLLKLPDTGLAILVSRTERIISMDEIITSAPGNSEFEAATLTLHDGQAALLATDALVDSLEKALAS